MFFHRLMVPLPLARVAASVLPPGVLEDAGHVVAVQDAELGLEAQHRVLAHSMRTPSVEGAHQHAFGAARSGSLARSRISAAALLVKVMAAMRCWFQSGLDQPPDLVRDDARLLPEPAPASLRQGPVQVVHSFPVGQG